MFRTFERHGVRYVLMGEFAAALHGADLRAASTDCCPARDVANLERLADALNELAATPRSEPALADTLWDAGMLSQVDGLDLATRVGDLSIGFTPAGTGGYEDLARVAEPYDLEDLIVPVASLDDLINAAGTSLKCK